MAVKMNVYDPRLDTSPGEHPGDRAYYVESENPALIAADFAPHPAFLDEVRAFWVEVAKAADYCDELVPRPMDEQRAREILGNAVLADGRSELMGYIHWPRDASEYVILDGSFSVDEIEAVAWWIRNKCGPAV